MSTLAIGRANSVGSTAALITAGAVIISILAFFEPLHELVRRWTTQEEYSHGFLIPLVSAWLLWGRRGQLGSAIGRPSFYGVGLVLAALVVHIVGILGAIWILSQIAFVLTLIGIVLAVGGYSLLRAAFIPIVYLLFAIPLPYFIDAMLTLKLQLISSELGVLFVRLFQIPVLLDGNIIDMGTYKLQVVEACSGLRYLYPLLSLSFLAAYLFQGRFWQRAVIFLSGIPIAIGMNGLRIGVVGFLVDRFGTAMAEGALHFFEGWIIFLACSALLAAEMFVLAWTSKRRFFDAVQWPRPKGTKSNVLNSTYDLRLPMVTCFSLLIIGTAVAFAVSGRTEIIPQRTQFAAFPTRLANWQGRVSSLDAATEQALKVDDYILADYSQPGGRAVNLYVAYYGSQRTNESPHSPIVCLPGGGWSIILLERKTFESTASAFPYNRAVIQNGANRDLVYYWFDERGRAVADEYLAKWYLLRDSVVKNRTDGALIRLVTAIGSHESEADADKRMQSFMRVALPRLAGFLPGVSVRPVDSAELRVPDARS